MVRLVVCRVSRATDNAEVATVDLAPLLVHHHGVPVAVFVLRFAQLAGERQLRLALFAKERAAAANLLEESTVEPEELAACANWV